MTALSEAFSISQPAISKHLKVLERAGLVSRGRVARFRPCRLNPDPLEEAARWIGGYRHFWKASLENLDAYARELHELAQQTTTQPARCSSVARARRGCTTR